MNIGTIIFLVIGGFLLLVVLFLPVITHTPEQLGQNRDEEREKAYRRGLIIGSLMEEVREMEQRDHPTGL